MCKNSNEGGTRVWHVRIEPALFFPELADPGTRFGFETGHDLVHVSLVAACEIALGDGVLVDASEKLRGIGVGCSGDRPLRSVSPGLLRGGLFFRGDIFRSIGHDTFVDEVGLLFHSGDEFGTLFSNVVLLAEILREVVELNPIDASLFHEWDQGFIKIEQGPKFIAQPVGFAIGESAVEHA